MYGKQLEFEEFLARLSSYMKFSGQNMLIYPFVWYQGELGEYYKPRPHALNFYDIFKAACDEKGIGLTSLNTQVVAFRDKNVDGSFWLETSPVYAMPDNRDEFSEFVNSLYASGGGDTPESGLEALDIAFSKDDWGRDDGYHRQVVILWTDAPYLVGTSYTDLTIEGVQVKWDAMPSGRRLILFAPNGISGSNGGSWSELDSWTNVMHITDTATGFEDMDYVIDNIIDELTGKGKASAPIMKAVSNSLPVIFRECSLLIRHILLLRESEIYLCCFR